MATGRDVLSDRELTLHIYSLLDKTQRPAHLREHVVMKKVILKEVKFEIKVTYEDQGVCLNLR